MQTVKECPKKWEDGSTGYWRENKEEVFIDLDGERYLMTTITTTDVKVSRKLKRVKN